MRQRDSDRDGDGDIVVDSRDRILHGYPIFFWCFLACCWVAVVLLKDCEGNMMEYDGMRCDVM